MTHRSLSLAAAPAAPTAPPAVAPRRDAAPAATAHGRARPVRGPRLAALSRFAALSLAVALAACGGSVPTPRTARGGGDEANPLGPSYVLIPLPTEDEGLLGRILPSLPEAGRSLEEVARANPCADKLSKPKQTPLASTFEDAQELSVGGKARAMLGTFGFSGDVERATHFVYKLDTQKRAALRDTAEYDACCKEKGCGYGYVSALIYGEGEYATGEESSASAAVEVAVASAGGSARLKILHKRKVRGWLAAVVTVTDAAKASQLGPLGVATAAGITEATVSETVKGLYERDKLSVEGKGNRYVWRDGRGEALTENDFVRRFRRVTGSDELEDVDRRRNATATYVTGGLAALSAGALAWGLLNLQTTCSQTETAIDACPSKSEFVGGRPQITQIDRTYQVAHPEGVIAAIVGGAGTAGFGTWFVINLLQPDGSATDHLITDRDAVLYANRYNRSLLRRTVKEVERAHSNESRAPRGLQLTPIVGFGTFGFGGRF